MKNLNNFKFASKSIENLANVMATILADGDKFASCRIVANVSQGMQPKKNGCPYGAKDIRKDVEYAFNINFDVAFYHKRVNAQLALEGKEARETQESKYVRIFDAKNGCIQALKSEVGTETGITKVYLYAEPTQAKNFGYYVNGIKATDEQTELIKKFKINRVEAAKETQGVDSNPQLVNNILLTNVTEIRANGLKIKF